MINGVINVYKEKGFTSHDVVAKLRGILKQKKIGHTGTLDPDAVGVLPVCLGNATKLCDMLTDKDKEYQAEILFGKVTDTQDISGKVIENSDKEITLKEVKSALQSFVGKQMQIPPMYSAIKVNGKKLYELARQGVEVKRQAREVTFYEIELLDFSYPKASIRVRCSKGTYIRTLCHDLGQKLGCGACMFSLVRLQVERFSIKEAYTLAEIEEFVKKEKLKELLWPVDTMFFKYPTVQVKKEIDSMLYNGNRLPVKLCVADFLDEQVDRDVRVYDSSGNFQGIYQYRAKEKALCPLKMFLDIPSKR
ncbi:MAG TPA: tRNA pseudouridine(55) synthase TruB [Lachnospiraceae bacterium]